MNACDLDRYPRELLHNIETHGFQVTSVFDPKGKTPNFAYSIGIQQTLGRPEMIVFGVRPRTAHHLISTYYEQAKSGHKLAAHRPHSGFSKKFAVFLQPVARRKCSRYMAGAEGFYGPLEYQAVQLVYPDKNGQWPWSLDSGSIFRSNQPLLAPVPLGRKRAPSRRKHPLDRSRLQALTERQR